MDKKLSIEERTSEKSAGVMVDLKINDQIIDTGNNPISSYSFWTDLEQAVQRAIYRIKTKNPKLKWDFNLSTMAMSEEQKKQKFVDYAKSKNPEIDVDKAFEIFDAEIAKIQMTGPNDDHPNPYLKNPINSDLSKIILLNVIKEYIKK
jgi:hypothetical protein